MLQTCVNINNYMLFLENKAFVIHTKSETLIVDSFFGGVFFFWHIHVYTWLFLNSDSITKTEFIALLKLDDRFRP